MRAYTSWSTSSTSEGEATRRATYGRSRASSSCQAPRASFGIKRRLLRLAARWPAAGLRATRFTAFDSRRYDVVFGARHARGDDRAAVGSRLDQHLPKPCIRQQAAEYLDRRSSGDAAGKRFDTVRELG